MEVLYGGDGAGTREMYTTATIDIGCQLRCAIPYHTTTTIQKTSCLVWPVGADKVRDHNSPNSVVDQIGKARMTAPACNFK
eukprot:scaffold1992_cov187-Amphora_coffeaeformis.AAC.36